MRVRLAIAVVLVGGILMLFAYRGQVAAVVSERAAKRKLPHAVILNEVKDLSRRRVPTSVGDSSPPTADQNDVLPLEFNLAVPFTSQAPFEDWNLPYQEACEEASVAMVDAFYDGRKLTKRLSDEEIKEVIEWETRVLGHWEDTTAEEAARILREKYGHRNVRVVYDPTIDDVKREVAQGRPVILPAAGRLLGNRYFRQPGPLYHMLLVRGWTKDGMIITNDPGTKRGEGYLYKPAVLLNAVHDWIPPLASGGRNGGDVYNGRKAMIVVEK